MKPVGVTINQDQTAVLVACKDDVDFEGVKELYYDNGEGGLDIVSGFVNHCLEPFEGMDDPDLVEMLTAYNDGEFGDANFVVRLADGMFAGTVNPEIGNPIINVHTGEVLYPSLGCVTSDNLEEKDEYDFIYGYQVG